MDTGIFEDVRAKVGAVRTNKSALIGMAAVLVLVAASVGFALFNAATANEFTISVEASGDSGTQSETAVVSSLFVHVSGSVARPGLYELSDGARVADAVEAAGGFTDDADQDSCNLARKVEDGEHVIVVPTQHSDAEAVSLSSGQAGDASSGLINVNTASAEQLETLPGIGKATAQKIVDDRKANGPFKSVDDLARVSGIGAKKLAALVDLICV